MADNPQYDEEPDPEPAVEPEPRKWAGKYESPEALEQGYRESSREAQNLLARLQGLEAENRAQALLLEQKERAASQAVEQDELKAMVEAGINIDPILKQAKRVAVEAAEERLKPVAATAEALAQIPTDLQAAASQLLEADPGLKQAYREAIMQSPKAAGRMLAAEVKLRQLANNSAEAGMHQQESAGDVQPRKLKKVDAGIVRSRSADRGDSGETPTNSVAEHRQRMIEERLKSGRSGFDKRFAKDLLAGSIEIWEDFEKPRRRI